MKITLFDQPSTRLDLLPFTFTRPISEIRAGILTIREKWQELFKAEYIHHTEPYLQNQYPLAEENDYIIRFNILPNEELIARIRSLTKGESFVDENNDIVAVATDKPSSDFNNILTHKTNSRKFDIPLSGPIYMGKNCEINKGSIIQGPFGLQ